MERTYKTADESGRRRKNVQKRIDDFISKIKSIDNEYLPNQALKKKDSKAYSKQLAVWRKKVQDACTNEKKYLAVENRLQISSYKKLVTRYRNALKELDFIHPKFTAQMDSLTVRNKSKGECLDIYRVDIVSLRGLLRDSKAALNTDLRDKPNERWAYNQVAKLDYEHPSLTYMKLSTDQMTIFKQDGADNLAKRQREEKRLTVPYSAWNLVFNRIAEQWKSKDYADLTLALMWFTGRRPIEILKLGGFKKSGEKQVLFSGQAKTKGRESVPYDIPVWYDSSVICEMLARVRKLKDFREDTEDRVNGRSSATLNTRVKKILKIKNIEAYDLRRSYGVYTELLINNNKDTRSKYIGKILGHAEQDLNTARSYDTVIVNTEGPSESDLARQEEDAINETKVVLLDRMDQMKAAGVLKTRAFVNIHAKVIEMINRGDTKFNMSRIGDYSKCNRLAIRDFLKLADLTL
jgi:hypothetical protein